MQNFSSISQKLWLLGQKNSGTWGVNTTIVGNNCEMVGAATIKTSLKLLSYQKKLWTLSAIITASVDTVDNVDDI